MGTSLDPGMPLTRLSLVAVEIVWVLVLCSALWSGIDVQVYPETESESWTHSTSCTVLPVVVNLRIT